MNQTLLEYSGEFYRKRSTVSLHNHNDFLSFLERDERDHFEEDLKKVLADQCDSLCSSLKSDSSG